jgi:putative nucleotidyltransferase with HDIG domain
VVDDELGPRESLRMILRPTYEVVTAASGREALEALHAGPIDLVTLDLNMPGLQGEELMRVIRRDFSSVEVIVITGYGSVESAVEGLRHGICDYIQKPFDVVKVLAAVARGLAAGRGRRQLARFLERLGDVVGRSDDVERILERLERNPRLGQRVSDLLAELGRQGGDAERERARTTTFLEVLAETIEAQHAFMRGHAQRTAFYASLLADRLGLSATEQEQVRLAGLLHDVGKIGVSTELIARPGPLDPRERREVERHPVIGADLVDPLELPDPVLLAVRHHHEWWDGRGYPDGLYGTGIPLVARILAIADAYDAMSSDRPYRRALGAREILEEIERFAWVQFDPALVKEFLCIVETSDVDLQLLAASVATSGREPAAPSA